MILHSIRLEGWRCFANPVPVGPFSEGLNVLHAPNGSGKSTLFEALRLALLDGHRVGGRDAEAVRPWGRALAPTVSVEFSHGGGGYRLNKRFLDQPFAELERRESGRWVRLAQGDAADEQVRGLLTRNPPGRGLARLENWGLAQILWAPQGGLELPPLSGDLVTDIRALLGTQVAGLASNRIEGRIEESYSQCFTPTGKLRTGREAPRLASLEGELAAARRKEGEAIALLTDFEESARRVEDYRAERAQAGRDAEELSRALTDARRRASSWRVLRSQQAEQKARVDSAEARYAECKSRIEDIRERTRELAETQQALGELREQAQLWAREVQARQTEAAAAKSALEDIRRDTRKVEQAQREADSAARYAECRKAGEEIGARLGRIAQADAALAERKSQRAALVAPDAKALRAIRKAAKDRDDAQTRIEAALLTLEITPARSARATVLSGEDTGEKALAAGAPARFQGSPEVVVDLEGVARIRASGPLESIEQHRDRREAATGRLEQLTEAFGTADLEVLEALREQAMEMEERVARAESELKTLLGGESRDHLEQERARLAAVQAQTLAAFPSWAENPPDAEAFREAAWTARRAFDGAVAGAEAAWARAQEALTPAASQHTEVNARLQETDKRLKSLVARLAELAGDGKREEEREKQLRQAAMDRDAAKALLEETARRLASFEDNPEDTVTRLEMQLEAAGQTATQALGKEKREEGKLEHLAVQGPYSLLASAQEEVARLERDVAREQVRVAAIRLLYDTVARCRAEAVAAIAGPVEGAASRLFQRIAGRRLGRVQFNERFEPVHVVPELAGLPVGLDNASGGEREQIFLATRLALAEVLAREERQLVVLDDVLLATDSARLARVMAVLEEAAQRLQVIVLTCHPERYRGLNSAQFLDLEAISSTAGSASI